MDFIKTSSLRALIELTFQRNWNGLIWMSRKGVTTKRVKTVQTALSRISAQTAQSGWPRNECSRSAKLVRPSEVSAKVQTSADHASRPGKHVPRSAKPQRSRHTAHDQSARAGNKPRGRATVSRTTADASVRAGKRPASGREFHRPISSADHSGRPNPSGHDRSDDRPRPDSGRSSRPTVPTPRSTRSPF
ncbi:unnamed protein product [Microthlaspi erraticum]|uniref:Uncharacterized protein n=1 Tax=Microthlaspi erraticum TaxID=1685480 RepID=A0A6D2IZU9_9BRAS|nr:unnamed protein product [Microthlaspi erraticum]